LILVLDEATSAVSITVEEELYRTCQELGITRVSVGHRTTLRQFHDKILELDGEGGWTFVDLPHASANGEAL
jgi:ABC-type uncharacterized transport system fused permease/ATPase subunit